MEAGKESDGAAPAAHQVARARDTGRASPPGQDSFAAAAARVVDYLNKSTPMSDWSVSRVAGGEQVHLYVSGQELLTVGDRFRWQEVYCYRMAAGASPVVPDVQISPEYADLSVGMEIHAYAGQPIIDSSGGLFGVLCGVGADPLQTELDVDLALLETFSDLLADHLVLARQADERWRRSELAELAASTDPLTGLLNRRGWEAYLEDAAARATTYGDLSAVVVIDLDGLKRVNDERGHAAGDAFLQQAAEALSGCRQDGDQVARIGGDEFTVLVDGVASADLDAYAQRYRSALGAAGVLASLGHALVVPGDVGGRRAFELADAAMYEDKKRRRLA
ncbi:GGDEF domain-containing protein [Cumulibacter manganitolerans]|uniref:GGDEF domain-containing protein n=1 Tax=Cumulibacter manganitolerans TaxID=1884992 RepID=UPI0012978EFC|nr:GGDEF domain-containing protein [Cumulibacter manganitolerans]